jgi:hypothetical protein
MDSVHQSSSVPCNFGKLCSRRTWLALELMLAFVLISNACLMHGLLCLFLCCKHFGICQQLPNLRRCLLPMRIIMMCRRLPQGLGGLEGAVL